MAKAPKFDALPLFDSNEYGLFKIHTHVDKVGFIYVNFDSSEHPIPWEQLNKESDEQPRLNDFALDDYVYHRTWTTNGKYNWKLVGENYNEVCFPFSFYHFLPYTNIPFQCYHCKTSHPGITKITNLDRYSVEPHSGRLDHFPPHRDDIKPEDIHFFGSGAFTYVFPNSAINLSTPYFFIMRVLPTSATTVTTEYQVFRNPVSRDDVFQRAADFLESIELEDYELMNGVQKNLNSGVFVNGPLHTHRENGVVYFKNLVQDKVKEHWKEEVAAGGEIWPARRNQQLHAAVPEQERFCQDVCACGMKSKGECAGAATA